MARRRVRLEEGIYEDVYGLAATVKVGRIQREARWPLGTDRDILRSWRVQKRAELDADRARQPKTARGALKKDGEKWILRKKGLACFHADHSHLRAWYPVLGPVLRSAITRERIEMVISAWRAAKKPVAVRTIRHRVRVLRELYQALDGAKAHTPVDNVKLEAAPRPHPKAVPIATLRKVAKKLKAAKDKRLVKHYARFLVRATTGQRPAQIMRALPSHIDWKRKIWWVQPAKGGNPIPLPLNAEMVLAWKRFAQANAWGLFNTARAAKIMRRHGWPAGVRPYDLRHTLAIDLLLQGADLGDVQGLLGHSQIQTTRTHYAPILTARLKSLTAKRSLKLA